MTEPNSTKENIYKLIEFRQVVYSHAMLAWQDALFDLLDALVITGSVSSFAKLSQSSSFRRKWSRIYAAIEDGRLDSVWLRRDLAQRTAQTGTCLFALDGSPWPRLRARMLETDCKSRSPAKIARKSQGLAQSQVQNAQTALPGG